MRIRIATLLLSAALIPFHVYAQSNASVDGIVADRVTGLGIPNVPITIYTRQAVRYETTSGSDGRFRITGMAPGIYETRVDPPKGYQLYRSGEASQMDVAPLGVGHTRVELTREVVIHGRVVDSEGKPVPGIQVKTPIQAAVTTNDRGDFVLIAPRLGYLRISALPTPDPKPNSSGQLVSPVPTYFPSALIPSQAQSILVRGDADVNNIEIRLQTVPVHRVQGKVVDESGTPNSGAKVLLVPVRQQDAAIVGGGSQIKNGVTVGTVDIRGVRVEASSIEAQTTSDADGNFEFSTVGAGDWQVVADLPRSRAISFSVDRSDIVGLELRNAETFRMTSSADISGLSSSFGPQPPAVVILAPTDARSQVSSLQSVLAFLPELSIDGRPAFSRPLPDGSYEMPQVVPGRYYVRPARGNNGTYAAAILLGGTDIMGQDVDLAPGAPPIRVIYKSAQGALRGRVTNSEEASVMLLPRNLAGLQTGYFARAQKDGTFELDNLPPGDYSVVALDRVDLTSINNETVLLRQALERGKPIKIGASQVTVELSATRWPE